MTEVSSDDFKRLPHMRGMSAAYSITSSTKERQVLSPECRWIVLSSILKEKDFLYKLYAAVVMPDHFHALFMPLRNEDGELYPISDSVRLIKGRSSRAIGLLADRKVPVWEKSYFDRIIRGKQDFSDTWAYILRNPDRAGFVKKWQHYEFSYTHGEEQYGRKG